MSVIQLENYKLADIPRKIYRTAYKGEKGTFVIVSYECGEIIKSIGNYSRNDLECVQRGDYEYQ